MRISTSAAAVACLLAAACGGGGQSPATPSAAPALSTRSPVSLKVMTFNIQHGIDGTSRYNLQRAIDTIARVQPDIVGLQEVTRNHPSYNCDDQPARIASGLRAATGQNWEVAYEQEWFTPDVSCQQSGRGDGRETEGLAILTRRSMSGPATTPLPGDSRIGLQVAVRDAYSLPIVVTHLTSGASKASVRSQQVDRLVSWARGFGEPVVLMGDFNGGPQAPELQSVVSTFRDAWDEATRSGRATGALTQRATRIDYIFFLPGSSLTLQSAEFVDTASLIGVLASDHQPFVATFAVR